MATITSTSGWPDATNTGVPAGVTLLPSGDVVVNTAGAVISGLDIRGTVYINAPNVTLINCKVTSSEFYVVKIATGVTGAVVQNCEINGVGNGNDGSNGIAGQGTFIANNIYNVENGITLQGNNSLIQDNYIHNLKASGSPHYDGIQIDGGISNATITHNTVINDHGQTAAVMIDNYFGPISNIKVDNNILVGGGYTVYSDAQFSGGSITGVAITNNHIGGGYWGDTSFNKNSPVYTGNVGDGATLAQGLTTVGQPPASSAPAAPTIASFSNDSGVVGDGVTNDSTLTLTGTAAANSAVKVFDGTTQIGTATANSGGAWSYTTAALADGGHNLTAKATNSSGQTSAASAAVAVKIDTAAPTAPTIAAPSNNASGGVNLKGTAEANSTVKVFEGTTQIGTATANSSGAWTLTTGALATGNHSLTAKATDAAGNTGAASATVVANIPTSTPGAPAAPKIATFSNDSGVAGDGTTNDSTLTLTGTAAANSTVKVFDGTTQVGTATANSSGTWSYTTATLADGNHNLTAKATDAAGNTSAASAALAVKVDTTAPTAPTMASSSPTATLSSASTSLVSTAAASTTANTNVVALTGTAEANSTVKVFDGTTQIGTATANSSGAWSYTTGALATGNHSFTSKAMDVAGNTGTASTALVVNIPSTTPGGGAPSAPKIASFSNDSGISGDGITSDSTLTLKGTAAASSTVKVFDGTKQIGTATADSSGAWNYTTTALADGNHSLTAKATDASGNTGAASSALAVKIDTTAPTAPKIASFSPDGKVVGDGITDADHVTLTGTAEANSTVKVFDGAKEIGTATANDSGAWNYATGNLADGSHSFTSKAVDAAGNISNASAALGVNVGANDAHGAGPAFTNVYQKWNDTVTFKGTADPYSQVTIYDNGQAGSVGTAKAGSDGTWSFSTKSAVSDTVHNFTTKAMDSSGNVSSGTGSAILGTNGADTLKGTSGNDLFKGNGGHDTFVFAPNFGKDVVVGNFQTTGRGHDVVQMSKSVFDDFADVLAHASQSGHDVIINAGGGNTLTLKDTKLAALDKTDFHFA